MGGKPRNGIRQAHLHIDGVSGCAGDMFLGAMIDLGVPASVIRASIGALGAGLDIRVAKLVRGGLAATDVSVVSEGAKVEEPYGHTAGDHDHEHHHRHYRDIRAQIEGAPLDELVAARSLDIFDRLATAEAKLHGSSIEEVAFHELGALDALADVVGAAAAIEWLAPTRVSAAPIAMGSGRVKTAHGYLPVPSPAALEVLRDAGAAIDLREARYELCTPTGAAILASIVTDWDSTPSMRPVALGYGSGDLELDDRPNVVRATVGQPAAGQGGDLADRVLEIECNLDDLSAEIGAHAAEKLFEAGALDVWWTPVAMKKGRPAHTLSVLAARRSRPAVLDVIFTETSTLGVRIREVDRVILDRDIETVTTRFGDIELKVARRHGEVVNVAPEFDSCAAAARRHSVALKDVFAAAMSARAARSKR